MLKLINSISVIFLIWFVISLVQVMFFNTTTASYPWWNFFLVVFGGMM